MRIWPNDDSIICLQPAGLRLCGRRDICASWEQIFTVGACSKFTLERQLLHARYPIQHPCAYRIPPRRQRIAGPGARDQCLSFHDGDWHTILHRASLDPIYGEILEAEVLH
jgi:hypothetical protein